MCGKLASRAAGIALAAIGVFFFLLFPARAADPAANSGERLALLVGVSEYAGGRFNKLPGAGNDITALGDVLTAKGYRPGNVVIMTNGQPKPDRQPTAANILRQLDLLLDGREENDLIVVALAGHGVCPPGRGWFFCPADADLADEKTLISIDAIYKSLTHSKAGLKVLLVDACRNDPLASAGRATSRTKLPENFTRPRLPEPPGGIAAFFSCSEGQVARERKDNDTYRGVFFKAVVDALSGQAADDEGVVTLPDLEKYVKREVQEYVRNEFSAKQYPEMVNRTVGLVSLVRGRSRPPVDVPVPMAAAPKRPAPKSPDALPVYANSIDMKFARIEPGTFMMGTNPAEENRGFHDGSFHQVELTHGFYMGVYHVTRANFRRFCADDNYTTEAERGGDKNTWKHESLFSQDDTHPVVNVTWNDAMAFVDWLNRKEHRADGHRYRLPTESEWEYACRAGTKTPYYSRLDDAGWFAGNSGGKTHPVGQKRPNVWGLYDMGGNAAQWCADVYADYPDGPQTDPKGGAEAPNANRVLRGGSWISSADMCRSAGRYQQSADTRLNAFGFRVVLELP